MSPDAFKQVAAGSTKNPMVAIKGKASAGNPNRLTISISPTKPPPGAPERTKALKMETTIAMAYVLIPTKGIWKMPNKKAIFVIDDNTEPSICIVVPIGRTILLISSGTPIFLHASMLTGRVATEL